MYVGGRDVSTGTTRTITTADGIRLAYRDEGKPKAPPPVVLLHGLGADASLWDDVGAALADRHRVYVPEMRGHGGSDWPGSDSLTLMRPAASETPATSAAAAATDTDSPTDARTASEAPARADDDVPDRRVTATDRETSPPSDSTDPTTGPTTETRMP